MCVFFSLSSFSSQEAPVTVVVTVASVQLPLDIWHFSMLLAKAGVPTAGGMTLPPPCLHAHAYPPSCGP